MSAEPKASHGGRSLAILALGAVGVVYGDIGTSPLYALKECFIGPHGVPVTKDNVLGVLSLIFWGARGSDNLGRGQATVGSIDAAGRAGRNGTRDHGTRPRPVGHWARSANGRTTRSCP